MCQQEFPRGMAGSAVTPDRRAGGARELAHAESWATLQRLYRRDRLMGCATPVDPAAPAAPHVGPAAAVIRVRELRAGVNPLRGAGPCVRGRVRGAAAGFQGAAHCRREPQPVVTSFADPKGQPAVSPRKTRHPRSPADAMRRARDSGLRPQAADRPPRVSSVARIPPRDLEAVRAISPRVMPVRALPTRARRVRSSLARAISREFWRARSGMR